MCNNNKSIKAESIYLIKSPCKKHSNLFILMQNALKPHFRNWHKICSLNEIDICVGVFNSVSKQAFKERVNRFKFKNTKIITELQQK
jgi:hypothetical protein